MNILSHLIIPLFNRHFYQEDCDKKKYFKRLKWQWWQELTLEKHVHLKYHWKRMGEEKKSLQLSPSSKRHRQEVKQELGCPSHWPATQTDQQKPLKLALPSAARGFAALHGQTLQLQVALRRGESQSLAPGTAANICWQLDLELPPGL